MAAAYASILASTKVDELKNRVIGLSELQPTGIEILEALSKDFNTPPATGLVSTTLVSQQIDQLLEEGNPLALPYHCRKIWGTDQQSAMVGTDIWEVAGYSKFTLTELIVDGKLGQYCEMPPAVRSLLLSPLAIATEINPFIIDLLIYFFRKNDIYELVYPKSLSNKQGQVYSLQPSRG